MLTDARDSQVGCNQVVLANHAAQRGAVTHIDGLAVCIAATEGDQPVVVHGRGKGIDGADGAGRFHAGNLGGFDTRGPRAETIHGADVAGIQIEHHRNLARIVVGQPVVEASIGRGRIGGLVHGQRDEAAVAGKAADLVVVEITDADLAGDQALRVHGRRVDVGVWAGLHVGIDDVQQ